MSENSKKAARVNSLKKKLQVRRAATGGPKGDFYSIGNVVKDEYGALFMIERYQNGKWIVVALHQRSFSPEIRNDLTRDAQHDERGLFGFIVELY